MVKGKKKEESSGQLKGLGKGSKKRGSDEGDAKEEGRGRKQESWMDVIRDGRAKN